MKARVQVMLKAGVLDPQGEAVRHAVGALGVDGVEGVRPGQGGGVGLGEGTTEGGGAGGGGDGRRGGWGRGVIPGGSP